MKRFKAWLKSDAVRHRLSALIAGYVQLVYRTGRWTFINEDAALQFWRQRQPFICAFWHGRLLMLPPGWRSDGQAMHMLISRHRDGELITRAIAPFGIRAIRGSTAKAGQAKGGGAALREILKVIKAGDCVGFTPDGPRGPAAQVNGSIIQLARMTGVPILPGTFGAKWSVHLNSWDRFLVALPFTKGIYLWGEPLVVPRDADDAALERYRRELEERMNRLSIEADARARA